MIPWLHQNDISIFTLLFCKATVIWMYVESYFHAKYHILGNIFELIWLVLQIYWFLLKALIYLGKTDVFNFVRICCDICSPHVNRRGSWGRTEKTVFFFKRCFYKKNIELANDHGFTIVKPMFQHGQTYVFGKSI